MRIEARDGESFEVTLRRFTRSVNNAGILREFRASQRFTSKADAARAKRQRHARMKAREAKRATQERRPAQRRRSGPPR
jgi:ribosomal protein S21